MGAGFARPQNFFIMFDYGKLLILIGIILFFVTWRFWICFPKLLYYWVKDIIDYDPFVFRPYGCWFFVGKQGSGKTISLVHRLEKLKKRYPRIKIYTNMGYVNETAPLKSLNDLLDISKYNGEFGTVFVIDEIQNEFSCKTSKDFPETLLSLITQQRKNRILILTTSQPKISFKLSANK